MLVRHGQSKWNKLNRFTGWVDVPLSAEGVQEAILAGKKLENEAIDTIFTSELIRAQMTAMLIMSQNKKGRVPFIVRDDERYRFTAAKDSEILIPVYKSDTLNERNYGALQGQNKDTMRAKYGKEQVHIWRRSYDVSPPDGESLLDTVNRVMPYFEKEIVPELEEGKTVLISAHGNSLRSIVQKLDGLSKEEVLHLEIPTGGVLIYGWDQGPVNKRVIS